MKKILVLTDLSDNAAHAAQNALNLAERMHSSLILYHTLASIPVIPNYAGGGFVTETAGMFAEDAREKLETLKKNLIATTQVSKIESRIGEGNLGDNIQQLLLDDQIDLIVMGAPEGHSFERLLTGSDTRAVIKATNRPVLIIPANWDTGSFLRLVLATDYNETDLCALRYLSKWVTHYNCRLDIVHIQVGDEEPLLRPEQKQVFEIFLSGLDDQGICCHDLRGQDPLSRLNRFCADKKVDVLAMVNYHHDFFSGLFGTSQTFKALKHLALPLLVIPGNFCDEEICPM